MIRPYKRLGKTLIQQGQMPSPNAFSQQKKINIYCFYVLKCLCPPSKQLHCLFLRAMVKRSACAAGNFQKTLVKSTVSKLQKWDAPKNKSQLTRQIDTASTNLTQAALLALLFFCMSVCVILDHYQSVTLVMSGEHLTIIKALHL